jgi:hypothetical protein
VADSTARISTFKISDQPGNDVTGFDQLPAPGVQAREYIAKVKGMERSMTALTYLSSIRPVSLYIEDVSIVYLLPSRCL